MGRYNFAPQNVHKHATELLQAKRIATPPPWYSVIGSLPPGERLVRPPMQREQKPGAKPGKRKSRLFKPLSLQYEQDNLRWEYFNDHPWELARPRVVLEQDGRDSERWDWSLPLDFSLERPKPQMGVHRTEQWDSIMKTQSARPINGEAVVQRQHYLMAKQGMSPAAAYDMARKEFYRQRHAREVETRVAREEALAVGAFFGKGPIEIGTDLEDAQYEQWKVWAEKEIAALKARQGSAYSGVEEDENATASDINSPMEQAEIDELSAGVPGSKTGQTALGGVAAHP